jgi:hypothetical protein
MTPGVGTTTSRQHLLIESSPSQRIPSSSEDASKVGDSHQLERESGHQYQNIILRDAAKAQLGNTYSDIYGDVKVYGKLVISS